MEYSPENKRTSSENQWLEDDVFPIEEDFDFNHSMADISDDKNGAQHGL